MKSKCPNREQYSIFYLWCKLSPLLFWKKKQVYIYPLSPYSGLHRWLSGKEPTCQCRRSRFHSWVRKIPWRRKWQPTPVFLPGKRTEEPGGLQSMGSQRVGHNWSDLTCTGIWNNAHWSIRKYNLKLHMVNWFFNQSAKTIWWGKDSLYNKWY